MRLVVDANILVAELIRQRGRKLIIHPQLELYMAEKAWDEGSLLAILYFEIDSKTQKTYKTFYL